MIYRHSVLASFALTARAMATEDAPKPSQSIVKPVYITSAQIGGVKLTPSVGSVVNVPTGDSVTIPQEWTRVWESDGYMKNYVIYWPDGPI